MVMFVFSLSLHIYIYEEKRHIVKLSCGVFFRHRCSPCYVFFFLFSNGFYFNAISFFVLCRTGSLSCVSVSDGRHDCCGIIATGTFSSRTASSSLSPSSVHNNSWSFWFDPRSLVAGGCVVGLSVDLATTFNFFRSRAISS